MTALVRNLAAAWAAVLAFTGTAAALQLGPYPAPAAHVWPVSGTTTPDGPLSSTFGPRLKASASFRYDWHRGIDIPAPCNTPLRAIAGGVARMAGDYDSYQDRVVQVCHPKLGAPASVCGVDGDADGLMDDANGDGIVDNSQSAQAYYANYLHLASAAVVPGQVVTIGSVVGGSGESGIAHSGTCHPDGQPGAAGFDHLHFEIRDGGVLQRHAVHPLLVLPYADASAPGVTLTSVDSTDPLQPVAQVRVTATPAELDFDSVDVSVFDTSSGTPVLVDHRSFRIVAWTGQYSASIATLDTAPEYDGVYDDVAVFGDDAGITVAPAAYGAASGTYTLDVTFANLDGVANAADLLVVASARDVRGAASGLPALTIKDTSVLEGDSGPTSASFTLTLSQPPQAVVDVDWATPALGGAAAGVDYAAGSGSISFAVGETRKTVTVPVLGDTKDEGTEVFYVDLSAVRGATLADGRARASIQDDDPLPQLSIADRVNTEVDSGTSPAQFTVTLSGATERTVDVAFATSNGTAIAGADYVPKSGSLRFLPGQTVKTFRVLLVGDTTAEPRETYFVTLSVPVNAAITKGLAAGEIVDHDPAVRTPAPLMATN